VTARAEQAGRGSPGPNGTGAEHPGEQQSKAQWRARLTAARRALPAQVRAERAQALHQRAVQLATTTGGPVCAYLPIGSEPGSAELPAALLAAGHEVLLPVVPAELGPLDWARYEGPDDLGPGPIGLREPIGPRLGPTGIAQARLVLVPALAVDRRGIRIGKGAGYYDRSLPLAHPGVPLVAVVYDEELVDLLPTEEHDFPVTAVLRPGSAVTQL
jgi:5-formyltetrahydrofolate cyclo-ligase